jgi:TM2 domain-containing membrane protein YozV
MPSQPTDATQVYCRYCGTCIGHLDNLCPACNAGQNLKPRNQVVAGLLALFLGGLGMHRFYLGQWWGIFYFLLCWSGLPMLIAFVEAIVFLTADKQHWKSRYGHTDGSSWFIAIVSLGLLVISIALVTALLVVDLDDTATATDFSELLLERPD